MSGHANSTLLTPFPPAVTEVDINSCSAACDPSFVTSNLLSLASYLVDIVNHTNIFGPALNDPFAPSLKNLYERLAAGRPSLTPLPAIAKDASRLRETLSVRVDIPISKRPLEDLEDIYYAVLARMQEMLHTLNMRIASAFNHPTDVLFPDGPSIAAWHASLYEYWAILNEPAGGRALDDAVRQGRINRLYEEIQARLARNEISHETAEAFLEELYCVRESTDGMMFVADWNPSVVGLTLEKKYRTLFAVEKAEDERVKREQRRKSKVPGKDVRVRKRRSGAGQRKRLSVELLLKDAEEGLLKLKDGGDADGGDANGGPVGGADMGSHADAQKVDKTNRIDEFLDDQNRHAAELNNTLQDRRPHTEWYAKSQRVSDYAAYLRGQASLDARSIVTGSTYNPSLDSGALRSLYDSFAADGDLDTMES